MVIALALRPVLWRKRKRKGSRDALSPRLECHWEAVRVSDVPVATKTR